MRKRLFLDPETHFLYKCRRDYKIVLASKDREYNLKLFPIIDEKDFFRGYKTREFIVGKKVILLMYQLVKNEKK